MSAEGDFSSIAETIGIDVFRNGGGNISIKQQDDSGLVVITDDEALLLLHGLAREMGYRVVKKRAEGVNR